MIMQAKTVLMTTGILGILSVAIGAFGAHGLKDFLIENGRLDTFETAVKYQFYHTLALLGLGVFMVKHEHKYLSYAAVSMLAGIVIFSGSLYFLCMTNIGVAGAITPIGGLAFICGWLFFILGVRNCQL